VYNQANSLLPPRDPEPEEVVPWEPARISPIAEALIQALVNAGYTRIQATYVVYTKFAYYWNVCGIRDQRLCLETVRWWMRSFLNPVIAQSGADPPPGLPPAVIFFSVVFVIGVAVVLLVAPDWTETRTWAPPCNLYLGVYGSQLWWMTCAGVSRLRVPYYKALVYQGSVITAHTYENVAPPVVTDRFHFWGSLEFRCWQVPWYRVYSTQHVDCIFVGLLERAGATFYRLRKPFRDHWAPWRLGVIPESEYCTKLSPCS